LSRFVVLVHYHELGLKGRNRPSFERQLIRNITAALEAATLVAEITRTSGRILVYPSDYAAGIAALGVLTKIPGVARVSLGERVAASLVLINAAALRALERSEPFTSFKVAARRANTDFALDSMTLNREVGSYLMEHTEGKTVRMKEPDVTVRLEVIKNRAYLYAVSERGIGGLPVGTAGKLICLLSSGLDSPVAAWQMIRRGAEVVGLHFSGAPETPDSSSYLVRRIAGALEPFGGLSALYVVHFGGHQRQIALAVPEKLRIIFYRRLMFAVASALALRIGAKGLVTGESLGQVASQTLDNIVAVDVVATLPVLRPLIGTDKQEIVERAEQLGTFAISTESTDDCCTLFMPRNPETHARLSEVEALWQELPHELWVEEILRVLLP
jgi:thiamine biosynthesis protein ThiI